MTPYHEKKKEDRKSQKKQYKKSDKRNSSSLPKTDSIMEDTFPAAASNPALDDIIAAFHRELAYQNDMLDHMRQETSVLKAKISEETEHRHALVEKYQSEIASLRKEAEEERRERRALQFALDALQGNMSVGSVSLIGSGNTNVISASSTGKMESKADGKTDASKAAAIATSGPKKKKKPSNKHSN